MNLALSDEQELLREAARGALRARQDGRGRARRARGAAELPDLWPHRRRGRLAGPAGLRGPRRRRAGRRSTRCSWPRSAAACSRACRCSGTCRRRRCSTARPATSASGRSPPASCARRSCRRARRATSTTRLDRRAARRPGRAPRAAAAVDGDEGRDHGRGRWVPDAPGADVLVVVGVEDGGQPVAVRGRRGATADVETVVALRRDARRSAT